MTMGLYASKEEAKTAGLMALTGLRRETATTRTALIASALRPPQLSGSRAMACWLALLPTQLGCNCSFAQSTTVRIDDRGRSAPAAPPRCWETALHRSPFSH